MKSVRMFVFVAVLLFLCACPTLGWIQFKDGLTHDINYTVYGDVWVDYQTPAMYTAVNLLAGGSIQDSLQGFENSRINIRGGSVWKIVNYGSSQVDVSGGSVSVLENWNSSQIDISGGSLDFLESGDSSQVNMSGGSIGNSLVSYGSSQVNISGGLIIYDIVSQESSQVNISGGSINGYLYSVDSSQVDILGGSIGSDMVLWDQSMVQIFGSDFAVDGQPFGYGELTSIYGGLPDYEPLRHLTGTLLSGELFDNDFYIGNDAKIVLVPEPTTVLLLTLGGLAFRKRR